MELERSGLITTMRTSGRVVTEDENMIREIKESIAIAEIENFFKKMRESGFSREQTMELAESVYKEEK